MNSLQELNAYGQTSIEVQDLRPTGIITDLVPPNNLNPLVLDITSTTVTPQPKVNILDIINYADANVRYVVKLNPGSDDPLIGSTITWASIPAHMTLTQVFDTYTITGFQTAADWEAVKNFTWTLPSNYATKPLWYLTVEIIYSSVTPGNDVTLSWQVYDIDHYYVSEMVAEVTLAAKGKYVMANGAANLPVVASLGITPTIIAPALRLEINHNSSTGQLFEANYVSDSTVKVVWGDGVEDTYPSGTGTITHTYSVDGPTIVNIDGLIRKYTQADPSGRVDVIAIKDWNNSLQDLSSAFVNHNIVEVPDYLPVNLTNISYMLRNNYSFNDSNLLGWETGNITNMDGLFRGCISFNQPIGTWDISSLTSLDELFSGSGAGAMAFNQNLNSWDVSAITSMTDTFTNCTNYNQPMNSWDMSSVTDATRMFFGCTAFNQDISNWDVSSVSNFEGMFFGAYNFNQNLSAWNTSAATSMKNMFNSTGAFNQNINLWDVSSVTDFSGMFGGATAFNSAIGGWDTSAATNMTSMFEGASGFNQYIGAWNTSNVTNMNYMFLDAIVFNQNLGLWETGNVSSMDQMFRGATAFNQDLSGWCVSLIPSAPTWFDLGATSWTLPRPIWGTCP